MNKTSVFKDKQQRRRLNASVLQKEKRMKQKWALREAGCRIGNGKDD
jgi:hypothetical protein